MNTVQVGAVFSRWTIIGPMHHNRFGTACYPCLCSCGRERVVERNKLEKGLTRSCGCGAGALTSARKTVHGHRRGSRSTREYMAWDSQRRRKGEQRSFTEWLAAQPQAVAA
jgi:hypothetical protein